MESSSDARVLPPARVVANRWPDIPVPEIGAWTPDRSLSIIIPIYNSVDALALTLAALAAQTYPAHLLQIVIADDGSETPIEVPGSVREIVSHLDIVVVRQARRDFGLARARNTGAQAATGDILLFVDCDMTPEPHWAEAHARWHHAVADAVTLGFRTHVEFDGITPQDVNHAARAGNVGKLFEGRTQKSPEWVDAQMQRTNSLTSRHDDLFRICTGGNMGMRAETYWAVGGSDGSFDKYGGEDTELGFRLFTNGDVLVPERSALCWHQGLKEVISSQEEQHGAEQRARIAHLVAERGFRRLMPGRTYTVPYAVVTIRVNDEPSAQVVRVVESVLAQRFHDLAVVVMADAHPERVWLEHQFEGEPRVRSGNDPFLHSPLRIELPPTVLLWEGAIETLVSRFWADPVGAIHVPVPGSDDVIEAVLTRALRRAERVAPNDVRATVRSLFGDETIDGAALGVVRYAASAPIPVPAPVDAAAGIAEQVAEFARKVSGYEQRAVRAESELRTMRARRAVRIGAALGRIRRARGAGELLRGLRAFAGAFRHRA